MDQTRTYLNQNLITKNKKKSSLQFKIGIGMLIFYSFDFIAIYEGSLDKYYIPLVIALMMPAFYLIWCSRKNSAEISEATKYDEVFCKDKNGIVTAHEMAEALDKKYFDIFVELERLFRCGYFVNCTLQQGRNPSVIMYAAQMNDGKSVGFMQVVCKKCGASTRIRANSRGKCEYCGSIISTVNRKNP
ncbi:MAG: hypothetical protein IKS48_14255 [Eubacterium sp.]|nr:hypothetical protein [Eubacterium sp.]